MTLPDPIGDVRIRPGQRKAIFAIAAAVGLRDEQLHDLVESASDYRTRAIAHLTIAEARRLIGILKTMERAAARIAAEAQPARQSELDDAAITAAVRRASRRKSA